MKTKICLALLLVMAVFAANILPAIAYEGWIPPGIQSRETVDVGGSIEKTIIFYGCYDVLAVVEFTVERGKEVKVNYELGSEKEGFGVRWQILNEKGYESYINEGERYASDVFDKGECVHATKTLFIDEPGTYYFVICAIVNRLYRGEDRTPVIYYKIEVEDVTPTPTPTPREGVPGFKALFAIAGLLAVAYLLRRRE